MPIPLIIAGLVKAGLSLVANAALVKGKEYIEDKTGVKLPDDKTELTPQELVKLKEFELTHEEELLKIRQEDDRIDLEAYKVQTADVANARAREVAILSNPTAGWEHMLERNITSILALIVVLGGGTILAFNPDKDLHLVVASTITLVLGYYFGTTQSTRRKDATIANAVEALK